MQVVSNLNIITIAKKLKMNTFSQQLLSLKKDFRKSEIH